ncbi:hypothetical protein [Thermodesulfatator atlanticus]|uniref:hypothetical protein n=1 Tax=Thermodesulfatator atlanticus TaxID=501497 RepID=UPI0003B371BB|nr:hypothetical protein [Thermodesulfatator atlanticus]
MHKFFKVLIVLIASLSLKTSLLAANFQVKPIFKPLALKNIKPITPQKDVSPTGPDPSRVLDLADILEDEKLLTDLTNTVGFDPHFVIQDKTATNVFYYVPRAFLLLCDEKGYHLGVQYNYQAVPGEPAVTLNLDLVAPFNPGDTKLLKYLLRAGLKPPPGTEIRIKALPALGAKVDLDSLASGISLSKERLFVIVGSHFRKPIRLGMLLTPEEVEEVLTQLGEEGLAGEMIIKIDDKELPVPLEISFSNFAGPKLIGLEDWLAHQKDVYITNVTYFPIKLRALCSYRLKNGSLEKYCRGIKGHLRPRKKVAFKLPPPEKILGHKLLLVWFDMSLDTTCKPCLAKIEQEVRRGVSLAPTTKLVWEVIPNVFETLNLYKVMVEIRSKALSSTSEETNKILEFSPENTRQEVLLYLHEPSLTYEYRIFLVTQDGAQFRQKDWQKADLTTQITGKKQLEEVLSSENEL